MKARQEKFDFSTGRQPWSLAKQALRGVIFQILIDRRFDKFKFQHYIYIFIIDLRARSTTHHLLCFSFEELPIVGCFLYDVYFSCTHISVFQFEVSVNCFIQFQFIANIHYLVAIYDFVYDLFAKFSISTIREIFGPTFFLLRRLYDMIRAVRLTLCILKPNRKTYKKNRSKPNLTVNGMRFPYQFELWLFGIYRENQR